MALAISIACLSDAGCKKSEAEQQAEEARKIIESKAALREQLRKNRIARAEREEWLKAHPEVLASAEPDEEHRPTAPVPSNLPPSLLGAGPPPEPDPAVLAAESALAASASASAAPRGNRPKKARER